MAERHSLTIERLSFGWSVTVRYPPELGRPDVQLVQTDQAAVAVTLRWMELMEKLLPRKPKGSKHG